MTQQAPKINLTDDQVKQALQQINQTLAKDEGFDLHKQELVEYYGEQVFTAKQDQYSTEGHHTQTSTEKFLLILLVIVGAIGLGALAFDALLGSISTFVTTITQAGSVATLLSMFILIGLVYGGTQLYKGLRG